MTNKIVSVTIVTVTKGGDEVMALKEELREQLEVILSEDRKKFEELGKQLESLVKEREELKKTVESAETLLRSKFGVNLPEASKETSKIESTKNKYPYKYKSTQDAAFEILLEEENRPAHIKDIYQRVVEGGKKIKHRSTIGVALRRDARFVKVGPNVFAITEEEYKKAQQRI